MRRIRRLTVPLLAMMLTWACGTAMTSGVKTGPPAPDFTLNDETGKAVTLSSFQGRKSVVLVFYRGQW
jgi:cytochrome oxidase Cu insertion factor (SCO1/SenC/PrrC family)